MYMDGHGSKNSSWPKKWDGWMRKYEINPRPFVAQFLSSCLDLLPNLPNPNLSCWCRDGKYTSVHNGYS